MGSWTDSVERKAAIIHSQLAMARALAIANRASPDEVSKPYLSLLRTLYADEFPFAQLTDSSDLVARFRGPAVDTHDPTVSIVISLFSDLREQIRGIAKSIVGLASDTRVLWPAQLDPHLSGIAHGSLLVGVSVSPPVRDSGSGHQQEIDGVSDRIFASVRSAVRSLSLVAQYVGDGKINDSIREAFPDPAVRDTVLVAARRLAPSGRRGIDSVSFTSPESKQDQVDTLTPKSRITLSHALVSPVRVSTSGTFDGMVREVDLDARRFEIRGVSGVGAIRCVYGAMHDQVVRSALDARIRVSGRYDTTEGQRPRFMAVDGLELLSKPSAQLNLTSGER